MQVYNDRIPEVDAVRIRVLADNYYDALRPDSQAAKRFRARPGRAIHAEHGLAYYVETEVQGKTSACMFDFGLDPAGVANNIEVLNIDPGKAQAFVLSHGHFDHWGGAVEILRRHRARIARDTPFYTGEQTFLHRYSLNEATNEIIGIGKLEKGDIEALGLTVKEVHEPTQIIPGAFCTGKIDRVTDYEKVPASLLVDRGNGPEADDFRGEQALLFNLKNKGLIVLSGCAHAGIVNTVRHAQKVAGIRKVHAILGGFHLVHAKPETIRNTVKDIVDMQPELVAPMHCTGFEATVEFSREMPEAFILNTAGTQYTFSA